MDFSSWLFAECHLLTDTNVFSGNMCGLLLVASRMHFFFQVFHLHFSLRLSLTVQSNSVFTPQWSHPREFYKGLLPANEQDSAHKKIQTCHLVSGSRLAERHRSTRQRKVMREGWIAIEIIQGRTWLVFNTTEICLRWTLTKSATNKRNTFHKVCEQSCITETQIQIRNLFKCNSIKFHYYWLFLADKVKQHLLCVF